MASEGLTRVSSELFRPEHIAASLPLVVDGIPPEQLNLTEYKIGEGTRIRLDANRYDDSMVTIAEVLRLGSSGTLTPASARVTEIDGPELPRTLVVWESGISFTGFGMVAKIQAQAVFKGVRAKTIARRPIGGGRVIVPTLQPTEAFDGWAKRSANTNLAKRLEKHFGDFLET